MNHINRHFTVHCWPSTPRIDSAYHLDIVLSRIDCFARMFIESVDFSLKLLICQKYSIICINQKQYYGMVGLCAFSPNAPGMKSYSWSIHRQNRVRYCGHLYIIPMCSWSVLRASVCRQPSAYCLYNLAVDTTKIFILSYNFAPGILSNALSKSTKKQCNGWPICQLYSFSTCR